MSERKIEDIVKRFELLLKQNGTKVYKIILFGSYCNGTQNDDSDIDLAVISDDFMNKKIAERAIMVKEPELSLMKEFDIPIDVIKLTIDEYENETRMIASYVKEGKVLYAA